MNYITTSSKYVFNKLQVDLRNLESDLIIYIMARLMVLVPIIVSLGIYITDLILKM